jgi:FHA domain
VDKRWVIIGGVAACWVILALVTGSAVSATVLLIVIGGLGAASVGGLRAMGVTRRRREGCEVLQSAMRHLSEVFVSTPNGPLIAPNVVELQLNSGDLCALREQRSLDEICASMTEAYEDEVARSRARFAEQGRADVYVVPDESLPPGRFRVRPGLPVMQSASAGVSPGFAYVESAYIDGAQMNGAHGDSAHGGGAHGDSAHGDGAHGGGAYGEDTPTVMETQLAPPIPALRLVTGSSVAKTIVSGARAGRGAVELKLPDHPTVSREHATFTFSDERWWVTNRGINGLTLNGSPVTGERPLSDGDSIRWGLRPDALLSRVEIG